MYAIIPTPLKNEIIKNKRRPKQSEDDGQKSREGFLSQFTCRDTAAGVTGDWFAASVNGTRHVSSMRLHCP